MAVIDGVGVQAVVRVLVRNRLEYLDGLRGLSALYVVMSHAALEALWKGRERQLPALLRAFLSLFSVGGFAVAIFIVLSGYCLMLPVAKSADGHLRGGVRAYIARRAWRILPPYYAALAFSLLLIALVPWMQHETGISTLSSLPAFRPDIILTHLFLVHNVSSDWVNKIDSPLWTVATEWQIYFLFPLLLLPVWRRLGIFGAVLIGFAIGLGIHFIFHGRFDMAAPWFLGLFALGMAAATVNFSSRPLDAKMLHGIPWGWLSGLSGALIVALTVFLNAHGRVNKFLPQLEMLVGFSTACLLVFCTRFQNISPKDQPIVLRLLSSPRLVALGVFSYSLYLTHYLLIGFLHGILNNLQNATLECIGLLLLSPIVCTSFAYLFHVAFERRFMTSQVNRS